MADRSNIEWTDATWNPVRGCTRVSAGCQHCYAERVAARFAGAGQPYEGLIHPVTKGWNGQVRLVPEVLDQPLRWRRPRRIFVNSMSDLFHEAVPFTFVAAVMRIAAASPQHTFQILTKRPDRALTFFAWHLQEVKLRELGWEKWRVCEDEAAEFLDDLPAVGCKSSWPLPNVWLGVSIEDQATADERIPILLQCPAAVRWVSVEPLLGPVDLRGWGDARADAPADDVPASWADFDWPDWVPPREREMIESFWSERYHRGPRAWMRDNVAQSTPRTGARVGYTSEKNMDGWVHPVPERSPFAEGHGRYLHRWNNIGVVVTDAGQVHMGSANAGPGWLAKWRVTDEIYRHRLHWVVAGGESGPGARPMHPAWVRSLRDQCAAAGVRFLFKQWGEWRLDDGSNGLDGLTAALKAADRGTHTFADGLEVYRYGKKAAGRLLDGVLHDAYPEVRA